ncbi:translation initiation factor 4E [Cryptococcus wingfieldii CBS 7118]|uniref:Translation initiation factor 4E n=1 Tax=Cryptococcus wingfieldii CBS 7118 TaxID=1295528 RepID=A0A1E3J929_9TREE|nr:translation initiation factor 4E [Cryptococcus wingfieldii CBS 7118]ODN97342.1 translation initiation factor 4E [Cryptococcus wingfieldii CBS 7118]
MSDANKPSSNPSSGPSSAAASPLPASAVPAARSPAGQGDNDRGLMLPPPVPAKFGHSPSGSLSKAGPPRMARLPSLKQLSEHLKYHPSASSPTSQSPNPFEAVPVSSNSPAGAGPLRITTNPSALAGSNGAPMSGTSNSPIVAPSPSGRLKLPASAMMRSLSAGSNGGILPTINSPRTATGPEAGSPASSSPAPRTAASELAKSIPGGLGDFKEPASGSPVTHSRSPSLAGTGAEGSASMSRGVSKDGVHGYRDVPTLEEIRRRVSVSKGTGNQASGSGHRMGLPSMWMDPEEKTEEKQEEVKEVEKSKPTPVDAASTTPVDNAGKKKEHPLQHAWTLYYDSKTYKPDPSTLPQKQGDILADYEMTLLTVGKFETIEGFARHFNNIRLPSQLSPSSNYHMFKNGIRPMWEDPANANGGKWVVLFRSSPGTMDFAWANLTMALVGEMLDPEDQVCGIVASARPKIDRIQLWTRGRTDQEGLNKLGKRIVEVMALEGRDLESMSMEYQYNTSDSKPPAGAFLHIPFPIRNIGPPSTPSRSISTFQGPPGSAFGGGATPRSNLAPSSNLTHPLPLPPKSPSVHVTDSAPTMRRGLSGGVGNPFAGPLGLARSASHNTREGIAGH